MALIPIHLGVVLPGCGAERDGGVASIYRIGPLVEAMAELVEQTTVLAYDPPEDSDDVNFQIDFVMRSAGNRMRFVSLGPHGTYRQYLERRARVREIMGRESEKFDLLFLPLVNWRVGTVFDASKCRRILSQIGGYTPSVVREVDMPLRAKLFGLFGSYTSERQYHRVAKNSLFFVNGEALQARYSRGRAPVEVIRTSVRRARESYVAQDRLVDSANILLLSRLTPPKGVFETLRAFAKVRASDLPNAHLHVVGSGDAVPEMQALADELGVADAVTWYGWVPPGAELFALIRKMDVMVTLSLAESLPNTVFECFANSVLVIATPVGALPHVFEDRVDLMFVPPKDPDAAAAALLELAGDPALRQRMLERGRATSRDVTVEFVAEELLRRAVAEWPELAQAPSARGS